jgi:guanylate kinase
MKKILLTLTGISGSGKTTLLRKLQEQFMFHKVITCTTRDPRLDDNEKDGVDYFFLSVEDFQAQVADGKFAENESFCGNHYGTRWAEIATDTTIPVAILEPKGAMNLPSLLESHDYEVIKVFIDCPMEVAIERISKRDSNIPDKLAKRIESIQTKEADWDQYNYDVIIPLNSTTEEVNSLIQQVIIDKTS